MSFENLPAWGKVQKRTFTKWANTHLAKRGMQIDDLAVDLSNGVLLVNLLEEVSGKSLGKYNRTAKLQPQKMENADIALSFIKKEGMKLVGVGVLDIVDGYAKMILGMFWTIIQNYQIATKSVKKSGSAKEELLAFVNGVLPEFGIKNFKADWKNGKAFCALVNHFHPGAVDFGEFDESNPLESVKKASEIAENTLNIPTIMEPSDLVSDDIDDLSVMTYLSYFRAYDLDRAGGGKGGDSSAPVAAKSKSSSSHASAEAVPEDPTLARVDFSGLRQAADAKGHRSFTITGPKLKKGWYYDPLIVNRLDNSEVAVEVVLVEGGTYKVIMKTDAEAEFRVGLYIVDDKGEDTAILGSPFKAGTGAAAGSVEELPVAEVAAPAAHADVVDEAQKLKDLERQREREAEEARERRERDRAAERDSAADAERQRERELADLERQREKEAEEARERREREREAESEREREKEAAHRRHAEEEEEKEKAEHRRREEETAAHAQEAAHAKRGEEEEASAAAAREAEERHAAEAKQEAEEAKRKEHERAAHAETESAEEQKRQRDAEKAARAEAKLKEEEEEQRKLEEERKKKAEDRRKRLEEEELALKREEEERLRKTEERKKRREEEEQKEREHEQARKEAAEARKAARQASKATEEVHVKEEEQHKQKEEHDAEKHHKHEEHEAQQHRTRAEKEVKEIGSSCHVDFSGLENIDESGFALLILGAKGKALPPNFKYVAKLVSEHGVSPHTLTDNSDGTSTLRFQATAGKHSLHIYIEGEGYVAGEDNARTDVHGSPFEFDVEVFTTETTYTTESSTTSSVTTESSTSASASASSAAGAGVEHEVAEAAANLTVTTGDLAGGLSDEGELGIIAGSLGTELPDGASFAANVFYEPDEAVSSTVFDLRDGTYRVGFHPTKSGTYIVHIELKDRHGKSVPLKGSPFRVPVQMEEVKEALSVRQLQAAQQETYADLLSLQSGGFSPAGEIGFTIQKPPRTIPITFRVTVACVAPETIEVPITTEDTEDMLVVSFVPSISGDYKIDIEIVHENGSSLPIQGSPFNVVLEVPNAGDRVEFPEEILSGFAPLGVDPQDDKSVYFMVQYREPALPESTRLEAEVSINGERIDVEIADGGNGITGIHFLPKINGQYLIELRLVDDAGTKGSIIGSPFEINIEHLTPTSPAAQAPPAHFPRASTNDDDDLADSIAQQTASDLSGLDTPRHAGECHFTVGGKGKKLPPSFKFDAEIRFTGEVVPVKILDNKDGTHRIVFNTMRSGEYHFNVFVVSKSGRKFALSGFPRSAHVTIEEKPAPSASAPKAAPGKVAGVYQPNKETSSPSLPKPAPGKVGNIYQPAAASSPSSPKTVSVGKIGDVYKPPQVQQTGKIAPTKVWQKPKAQEGSASPTPKNVLPPWVQRTGKVWKAPAKE